MDHGLLAESFDRNTREAKTGVGFATGAGYLAFALHYALFTRGRISPAMGEYSTRAGWHAACAEGSRC